MKEKIILWRKNCSRRTLAWLICLIAVVALSQKELYACHESALITPAPTYVYDPATDQTTVTVNFSLGITDFAGSPASNVIFTTGGCVGNASLVSGGSISAVIDRDGGATIAMNGTCSCTAGPFTSTTLSWSATASGLAVTYTYNGFSFGNVCQIACEANGAVNSAGGSATLTDLDGLGPNDAIRNTLVFTVEGFATSVVMSGFETGACGTLTHNNPAAPTSSAPTPNDAGAIVNTNGINVICFGESLPVSTIVDNGAAILSTGAQLWSSLSGNSTTNGISGSLTGTRTLVETCDGTGGNNTTSFQTPGYNDAEDPALSSPTPTITSANANTNSIISNFLTYYLGDATGVPLATPDASNSLQYVLLPDISIATITQSCSGCSLVATISLRGGYPTPGGPGAGTNYTLSGLSHGAFSATSVGNLTTFTITIPAVPSGTTVSFNVTDTAPSATSTGPCTKTLSFNTSTICSNASNGTITTCNP